MKFLLLLAASFGIVLLMYTDVAPAVDPCPHPNFLANHLCAHCTTLDDAGDFSKYRPHPSGKNTVFFGMPKFEQKSYLPDRCGNVDGVTVAVCTYKSPNVYNCRWLGTECYGEHSITNGHLFYQNIKCF